MQGLFVVSVIAPVAVYAQTTPNPTAVTPANTGSNSGTAAGTETNFTPLTQLPGIQSISTASSFTSFLNTLYKICIGVGAVLAVLMIMYAGVLIMTSSGSVSSNEKAKNYIQNAILGLVLVLTPTIVFGIINPRILNIDIGAEFKLLATQLHMAEDGSATNQVDVGATTLGACNITADTAQLTCINNAVNTQVSNYDNCLLTKPNTDCVAPVKAATPAAASACIPNLTSAQTSCLATQWGNAMTSGITKQTNSCGIYDSFKTIVDSGNPNVCGTGFEKIISPGKCTPQNNGGAGCNVNLGGEVCCGHIAQTTYLLAYHYTCTPKNAAGAKDCGSASQTKSCTTYAGVNSNSYFPSQDACVKFRDSLSMSLAAGSENTTNTNLIMDKSCVAVSVRDYKPPADPNACVH